MIPSPHGSSAPTAAASSCPRTWTASIAASVPRNCSGASMTDAFSLAAQLVTGWLVADFLSGIIHWIEERVLWVGMPLISKSGVQPNGTHHRDPDTFLAQTTIACNPTAWAAVRSDETRVGTEGG